eukprot:2549485-Rhodomonas_salina.3
MNKALEANGFNKNRWRHRITGKPSESSYRWKGRRWLDPDDAEDLQHLRREWANWLATNHRPECSFDAFSEKVRQAFENDQRFMGKLNPTDSSDGKTAKQPGHLQSIKEEPAPTISSRSAETSSDCTSPLGCHESDYSLHMRWSSASSNDVPTSERNCDSVKMEPCRRNTAHGANVPHPYEKASQSCVYGSKQDVVKHEQNPHVSCSGAYVECGAARGEASAVRLNDPFASIGTIGGPDVGPDTSEKDVLALLARMKGEG